MILPRVSELRAENWAQIAIDERLLALNRMEKALAEQEGRELCEVRLIPEDERVILRNGEPALRGQYDQINKEIQLDPILFSDERSPYQAVETYFHEARHAYQHYAIEHPETHSDSEQVADWEKNHFGGYIDWRDVRDGFAKYSDYRWQPVEADAREVARERTNELYTGIFHDTTNQYQQYHSEKQTEISTERNRAIKELGTTDYEREAYLHMLSKHDASQAMSMDDTPNFVSGDGSTPGGVEKAVEQEVEELVAVEPHSTTVTEPDEDYDYSYVYGL
ncbi:MAG: hypothetical protein MN733_10560 [Nitrososphaera sp.]|nr:hypothetical protein [Nitrososphaera sp.]